MSVQNSWLVPILPLAVLVFYMLVNLVTVLAASKSESERFAVYLLVLGGSLVIPVLFSTAVAISYVFVVATGKKGHTGQLGRNFVAVEVLWTKIKSLVGDLFEVVTAGGGSLFRSVLRLSMVAKIAIVLTAFAVLATEFPRPTSDALKFFMTKIWAPVFMVVGYVVNAVRLALVAVIPVVNSIFWFIPNMLWEIVHGEEPCFWKHMMLLFSALSKGFGAFFHALVNDWFRYGIAEREFSPRPAFLEFQTAIIEGRNTFACTCETLDMLGYLVYVPFTPLPNVETIKEYGPASILFSQQTRSLAFGAQFATPALVDALSNATASVFNVAHSIAAAIKTSSLPDFNPTFNNLGNWTMNSGLAIDQSVQGAVWIIEHFAKSNEAKNHTSIQYEPVHFPNVFEFLAGFQALWFKVPQQLVEIMRHIPEWTPDGFSIDILFEFGLEQGERAEAVLNTVFHGSKLPFALHVGETVRNAAWVACGAARWVYDVLVYSVVWVGRVVTAHRAPFSQLVHQLNQRYFFDITVPLSALADSGGFMLGYSVGPFDQKVVDSAAAGCFVREGIQSANMILNGTMTIMYKLFEEQNALSFYRSSVDLADTSFAAVYRLGICLELVFENTEVLVDGGKQRPCDPEIRSNRIKNLVVYPMGSVEDDMFSKVARQFNVPNTSIPNRDAMCMTTHAACARLASGSVASDFIQRCATGVSLSSGMNFSASILEAPTVASTSGYCLGLAMIIKQTFVDQCFAIMFDPDSVVCSSSYLVGNVWRAAVDLVRNGIVLLLKGVSRVLVSISGKPVPDELVMHFPKEEVTDITCNAERFTSSSVALVMSVATTPINRIARAISPSATNHERIDNIETAIANLLATIIASGTRMLLVPLKFVEAFFTVLGEVHDIRSVAGGFSPRNGEGFNHNIVVMTVDQAVNVLWDSAIGIMEAIMRVCELAEDGGTNKMDGLLQFFTSLINVVKMLRVLSALLVNLMFLWIQFWVGLIAGLIGSLSGANEPWTLFTSAVKGMSATLKNFFSGLGKMIGYIFSQLPGIGTFITKTLVKLCNVVKDLAGAFSKMGSGIKCGIKKAGSWIGLGSKCKGSSSSAPDMDCSFSIPDDTNPKPMPIPAFCTEDSQCRTQSATCEISDGDMDLCSSCTGGVNGSSCNILSNQCQCGVSNFEHKSCSNVSQCGASDTCVLVGSHNGLFRGVIHCGRCASAFGSTSQSCGAVADQPDITGSACQCSMTEFNFTQLAHQHGTQCSTADIGATCNPASAAGYAFALDRASPLAQLGRTTVHMNNLTMGPAATTCDATSGGRCANTWGLAFPATCICQAHTSDTEAERILASTSQRRLLSDEHEVRPLAGEMITVEHALAVGSEWCRTDLDCTGSNLTMCDASAVVPSSSVPCSVCTADNSVSVRCDTDAQKCLCLPRRGAGTSDFGTIGDSDEEGHDVLELLASIATVGSYFTQTRRTERKFGSEAEELAFFDGTAQGTESIEMGETLFMHNRFVFREVLHGAPWEGTTWCERFVRGILHDTRHIATFHASWPELLRASSELRTSTSSRTSFVECMESRERAWLISRLTNLPVPPSTFMSIWNTVATTVQLSLGLVIAGFSTARHGNSSAASEEIAELVEKRIGLPVGTGEVLHEQWLEYGDRVFRRELVTENFQDLFEHGGALRGLSDDPMHPSATMGHIIGHIEQLFSHPTVSFPSLASDSTRAIRHLPSALASVHTLAADWSATPAPPVRVPLPKNTDTDTDTDTDVNADVNADANADTNTDTGTDSTGPRAHADLPVYAPSQVREAVHHARENTARVGRKLLHMPWNLLTIEHCAVVTALSETFHTVTRTLSQYYATAFMESMARWRHVNDIVMPGVSQEETKDRNELAARIGFSLRDFLAEDDIRRLYRWVVNLTWDELFATARGIFLTCPLSTSVMCPSRRPLLKGAWIVILVALAFTFFVRWAMPFGNTVVLVIWLAVVPWAIMYAAYDYPLLCVPLLQVPTCFIDDITDVFFAVTTPTTKFGAPLSYLDLYASQGLHNHCRNSTFGFDLVTDNIAFTLAQANVTRIWTWSDSFLWRSLFKAYSDQSLFGPNSVSFSACNLVTGLQNTAFVFLVIQFAPLLLILFVFSFDVAAAVVNMAFSSSTTVVTLRSKNNANLTDKQIHRDDIQLMNGKSGSRASQLRRRAAFLVGGADDTADSLKAQ